MSLLRFTIACLVLLAGLPATTLADAARPNIVLMLIDDMGWSDLGCYGGDLVETPNIDRLAGQSVRFTNAYAMSVCTPTRATLLTGKHAARLQMTIWSEGSLAGPKNRKLLQASSRHDLPHTETTLARHLQKAGYLTAMIGKWHLGDASHFPETHGFDINIGGTHWGAPETFFWPYRGDNYFKEFRYVPDLPFGKPGEYLTDRLTDEAIGVIDRAGDRPFFVYLSHHAVHTPIQAKPDDVRHFEQKLKPAMRHQNPIYAAMVKNLDDNVGRMLDHLTQRGLEKNTIVIFASDNGGYIGVDRKLGQTAPVTSNAPLRSGKGSLYEGGIRVPLIVRWPGVTPEGKSCEEPAILTDLFPTLANAVGLQPIAEAADGVDIAALLKDPTATLKRDALYFHYPHYYATTTPVGAIRAGDWKLLEYFEDNRLELYHLKDDPAEEKNLADANPAKARELLRKLHDWRAAVGAQMPTQNPDAAPPAPKRRATSK